MTSTNSEPDAEKVHGIPDVPPIDHELGKTELTHAAPGMQDDTALALIALVNEHDKHHPIHWSAPKRWAIITVYCFLQLFVTLTSTTYVGAEYLIQLKFGGSSQVVTLGQSLFIVGNAVSHAIIKI